MDNMQNEDVHNNYDINNDDAEAEHFERIASAFQYYRTHSLKRVAQLESDYDVLPAHHKAILPQYKNKLDDIRHCIDHNFEIIKLILANIDGMFVNMATRNSQENDSKPASELHMDKIRSTLKQFVRDWSSDGQRERDACYLPVIQTVQRLFPGDIRENSGVKILVPGSGLGRLAWEFANLGFTCQGNEFSLFMLFASNFILNKTVEADQLTLYPWALDFCNVRQHSDQTRPITFPDVCPQELPDIGDRFADVPHFSMVAGDFLQVYIEPEKWDCVCTVFFIDTAHNIMEYIENIWKILKPGGYWINLGPLLYHFAGMPNERSIELTYEEVKTVIQKLNFEIVEEKEHVSACYTGNQASMLQYNYDCVFFVARKPLDATRSAAVVNNGACTTQGDSVENEHHHNNEDLKRARYDSDS